MQGETVTPVALPDPKDKRFAAPEWTTNPVFDFLKQSSGFVARKFDGDIAPEICRT
jgi:hypothetical protein